jgi:hypothetical protein
VYIRNQLVLCAGALRGLSSNEVLRMSADVLKNEVIGVSNSIESPQALASGDELSGRSSERSVTAEARAAETERALKALLNKKSVAAITPQDVSNTIGAHTVLAIVNIND